MSSESTPPPSGASTDHATSTVTTGTAGTGGRTGGRGRGERGRGGRNGRSGGRGIPNNRPPRSSFKGETAEMNGHVFQCFDECQDPKQFLKTLEALSGCSAKHQKHSGDVSSLFKDPEPPVIDEPQDPPDSEKSKFKLRSWEQGRRFALQEGRPTGRQFEGALRSRMGPVLRGHAGQDHDHRRLRDPEQRLQRVLAPEGDPGRYLRF